MLNYRQSGHPGGSRSKVHLFVSLLLSGAMRWDIRRPWRPFGDRFVLVAGHTVPLIYATLAVLNEALRARAERDPTPHFVLPDDGRWALTWEDLLKLRRRGGLPGHAEMEGKTLFLKFNTGPSGHGMPPAAGEAVALKQAGAEEVKVFAFEGEGGLTPGAAHETRNSAWGLGLDNLVFLVDWNDFGIDDPSISSVVHGTPEDWFDALRLARDRHRGGLGVGAGDARGAGGGARREPGRRPIDGLVQDAQGPRLRQVRQQEPRHAARHELARVLGGAQGVHGAVRRRVRGVDEPAPTDAAEREAQARHNFGVAMGVLRADDATLVDRRQRPAGRGGGTVPDRVEGFHLGGHGAEIFNDPRLTDVTAYPAAMWKQPGEKAPNRAALATWGAWVNAYRHEPSTAGRSSSPARADLAESTNIAGFAKDWRGPAGLGLVQARHEPARRRCCRSRSPSSPTPASRVGIATVNLADDPMTAFNGFWAACSTYGSFSYLKYGPMRLFSQLAQDCELKVGKVLWVAGHSGPETAEDSRTHFGIFEPGVTQLFPEGHVIDLHPWEYNEVPVVLAAALRADAPIVALHLTRPRSRSPTARRWAWPRTSTRRAAPT